MVHGDGGEGMTLAVRADESNPLHMRLFKRSHGRDHGNEIFQAAADIERRDTASHTSTPNVA